MLVLDIFNGQGYSEPTVEFFDNEIAYNAKLAECISSYNGANKGTCTMVSHDDLNAQIEMRFTIQPSQKSDPEDSGVVVGIAKPKGDWAVLTITPDICEYEIEWFENYEDARKVFVNEVSESMENASDEDECDEVDRMNDDRIGLHTDLEDGFYFHQIIKTC